MGANGGKAITAVTLGKWNFIVFIIEEKGEKDLQSLNLPYHFGIFAQVQHLKLVYATSDVLKERRIS